MASGARKSPSATIDPARSGTHRAVGRVIEYQQYIDGQLRKTRARVKWVDFWTSLVLLGIGVLGYLLVAALIDHWIIPGGLGFFGRLLLLVGLLAGVGAHLALNFFPHVLRRVNPVYAAAAIERGQPMKNTLVNFLLLRRRPEEVPEVMLEAMKEQAAVRLSGVPGDAPVDRTALIRWGYVLIAVLVAAVGYSLAGPKDALRSMGRVMAPWADLAAPTRVSIVELTPGDVEKRRDDVVEINLRTRGMRAADAAAVYYSPSGLPEDDVAVPLQSDDQMHWKAVLPAGGTGLQQDIFYYVQVGDAQSPRYRVRVLATPVISVASVRYEYPAYTGLPPRTVDGQGDLKALEGTRVVLAAEANQPIGAAYVAFDQARNKDVPLAPDAAKRKAIGSFSLGLTKDRTKPLHASYVLRFTNIDGQENPKPVEHRIEVTADQPPELKVVEPTSPPEKELQVAIGDALRITLAAQDVDFQLANLSVVFERYGAEFREEQLLLEPRYEPFSNTFVFEPGRYGLKPGDKLNFRGRARDNRTPEPNIVESARYTIVVAGGAAQPNQQQQQPPQQGNPQNQPPQQQNPNEQMPGRPPERGVPNPDQPPPAGQPQKGDQPKNDQPQNNAGQPNPNQQPKPGEQQPGQQQQPGQNGRPQDPSAPQQQPGMPQNGEPSKGRPQDGGRENGEPQDGNRQNGEQGKADQRNGAAGDQASAGNKQQEEKPIDPTVDPGRAFEELQKHFDKQAGDKQNKNDAGKQPEQHASADDKQQQDRQPGGRQQPQPGEQKSGEGMNQPPKNEAGKPGGETQPGEQQPGEKADGNSGGAKPEQGMADKHGRDQEPRDQKNGAGKKPGEQQEPGETGSGKRGGSGGQEGGGKTDGNQGSESGGGGQGSNQQKPSDQKNGAAGGTPEAMQKQDGAQGSGAEQRPGDNNGQGREVSRKPTDGAGAKPGEEKHAAGDKPESMQGAQPTDKPAAGDRSGDPNAAPAPGGNRPEQKPPQPGDDSQNASQKMGGNPAPDKQGNQTEKGDSGSTGGAAPEQGKKPQPQPGEQAPTAEGGAKPSANAEQPSGNDNPGGAKGNSPNEGSPEQQGMTKPRDKTGKASSGNQQESSEKSEGQSPSGSKNESDSQGDTSGDQSGKGEQGGGMKSNQKGTGAAGSNTAGDQGAGAANEAGDAATGNQAGDKVRSQSPTGGRPSGDQGDGSNTQSGGRQPGGKSDSAQTGGRPEDDPSQRQNPTEVQDANRRGGANSGGGGRPEGDADPQPRQAPEPGGDEANLEYTKKVTDLTLDRLKNDLEKGTVDPELLKRFSSKEALEQFVRRWDEMRKAAAQQGPQGDEARKQFTDTLKGLGLRSGTTEQQGARTGDDDSRQLRGARRSAPPAKFADQYRAYTTGIGQGAEK